MTAPDLPTTVATATNLRGQVTDLRTQLSAATSTEERSQLAQALASARAGLQETVAGVGPANLFAGLDPHVPLVLLPVRLETRFGDPGTSVLHVRIFPDEVHVDGHDPALTRAEAALGTALWAAPADMLAAGEASPSPAVVSDGPDGRRARWAAMVQLLGGPRAAWVAHATHPGAPAPTIKDQAYTRPPVARALPDRWVVRAYVGASMVAEAWSNPVAADPALAPDPQAVPAPAAPAAPAVPAPAVPAPAVPAPAAPAPAAPAPVVPAPAVPAPAVPAPAAPAPAAPAGQAPATPPVDPGMEWLVDYAAAVKAGMAADVTLPAGTNTLDRVVAVGVRASSAAPAGAAELATLFGAHRYTDGLGFLAAGAPTANAPDARAAADRRADPDALWQQEFGEPAPAGSAASRLASALGIPNASFDGTAGADDPGDAHAQAMQTALWAATWGYYLGELLDSGGPSAATIDAVRNHYLNFVRGQGTLPTLRVGRQPYGLLPTLPLAGWTTDGASPTVDALAHLLGRVRPLWEFGTGVPLTASEGPAFDQAFAAAMSTDAVARAYAIRSVIADLTIDPLIFTGVDPLPSHAVLDAIVGSLLPGGRNPLVLDVLSPSAEPVRAPFVMDPRDPSPDATVRAAISQLAASNPTATLIQNLLLTPRPQGPATLLHTLLRRSLLLEYAAAGVGLRGPLPEPGPQVTAISTALRFEAPVGMLRGLSPDPAGGFTAVTSLSAVVSSPVAAVTGGLATGEWLWRNPNQFPNLRRTLDQTLAALGVLATLSASELELLLPNALDLATHRFTAWAESVSADKLARLRQATPAGATLGGWGVVERLTRAPKTAVDVSLAHGAATGTLWETDRPGGFVAAPSTAQAATAAVLRAAHLAHGGDNDPTCAVDLSSTRARGAASLADGVRSGQELGALLGYELERFLHESSADALIGPLRAFAPRWKASGTFVEGQPETNVSPSAVVDGLALVNADPAAVAQTVIPGGPGASPSLASALAAGLANLRDHQDALADLLMAEAVHHTLAGNTARAAGVLDAAHRGGPPPDDFDVLRTPRGGAGLTCRVGVLTADPSGPLPGGWPDSPRGHADPACANLVAGWLPPLTRVRLRVSNAAGAVSDAEMPAGALIGPLDLVLDVPAVLRTRIELALPSGSRLVSGRSPSWPVATVGLDELQTVAADVREVLAGRALTAADLLPASSPPPTQDPRDGADLAGRVRAQRGRDCNPLPPSWAKSRRPRRPDRPKRPTLRPAPLLAARWPLDWPCSCRRSRPPPTCRLR